MANAFAPIADKLKCFIRLLSSDSDGEVVAAARALDRTLKGAKLDIHVLADSIGRANGGQLTESEMRKLYDAGYEAGVRTTEDKLRAAGFHDIDDESNEDLAQMAIVCALRSERLRNDREREFVRKMVQWTARGRRLSEKQEDWLRDCHERARQ